MKTLMVALLALLLGPVAAQAATLELNRYGGSDGPWVQWSPEGTDGASDADLRIDADGLLALRDAVVPIRALDNCTADPDGWFRCLPSRTVSVSGRLGDGDDRVRVVDLRAPGSDDTIGLNGGPGNDTLEAVYDNPSTAPVHLSGDYGDDTLVGGRGDDRLHDGVGSDRVFGGDGDDDLFTMESWQTEPDTDEFHGGGGGDVIRYGTSAPVVVDLAAGTGGVRGEDRLVGIEHASGSTAGDELRGDEDDNVLDGFQGRDLLDGRGGDDTLRGAVVGTVVGGPGDDTIEVQGIEDRLSCGPGRDRVLLKRGSDQAPTLPLPGRDCEQVGLPRFAFKGAAAGPRSLRLSVETVNTYCKLTANLRNRRGSTIRTATKRLHDSLSPTFVLETRRAIPAGSTVEVVAHHCSKRAVPRSPTVATFRVPAR